MDDEKQSIGIATLLPHADRMALVRAAEQARHLPDGIEKKKIIEAAIARCKAANPRLYKKGGRGGQ